MQPDPRARYHRLRTMLDAGRIADAASLARDLVRENPEDHEARFLLGVAQFKGGDFPGAESRFSEVTNRSRDHQAAYYLGLSQERQGRIGDARAAYGLALAFNPDFPQARQKLQQLATAWPAPTDRMAAPSSRPSAPPAPVPARPAAQPSVRPPSGRGFSGVASKVKLRAAQYGRSVLTFVVTRENGDPVAVEMRGRLYGSVEEGDHVEVPGRPRGGTFRTFRPGQIRNLSTGGMVKTKMSPESVVLLIILGLIFAAVFFLFLST